MAASRYAVYISIEQSSRLDNDMTHTVCMYDSTTRPAISTSKRGIVENKVELKKSPSAEQYWAENSF